MGCRAFRYNVTHVLRCVKRPSDVPFIGMDDEPTGKSRRNERSPQLDDFRTEVAIEFGRRVRVARKALSLSQDAVVQRLKQQWGISIPQSGFADLENGKRATTVAELMAITDVLHIGDYEVLLGEPEASEEEGWWRMNLAAEAVARVNLKKAYAAWQHARNEARLAGEELQRVKPDPSGSPAGYQSLRDDKEMLSELQNMQMLWFIDHEYGSDPIERRLRGETSILIDMDDEEN